MHPVSDVAGGAALSICESLMLCLTEKNVLSRHDIAGILEDAASAHIAAAEEFKNAEQHRMVAELITAILNGGDSVFH